MDLRFLDTFLEVARTRHFGKAAENLYLTQSAVSARIKLLEEYFNVSLFVRNRNSILLTSAGEKLIPFAQSMSVTLNDARKSLNEDDLTYLVCAATPNASELFLNNVITGIKASFDTLSIRAEILNSEQLSRQLHERIVDIAFTTELVKSEEVENIPIMHSRLVLLASTDIDKEKIFDNYLHLDWGNKISKKIHSFYPQTKRARFKSSCINIALKQLKNNFSSIILTECLVNNYFIPKKFAFVENIDDVSVPVFLVYLKDTKNTAIADIIDFCQNDLLRL